MKAVIAIMMVLVMCLWSRYMDYNKSVRDHRIVPVIDNMFKSAIDEGHDLNSPEMKRMIAEINAQIPTVETVRNWDMKEVSRYAALVTSTHTERKTK